MRFGEEALQREVVGEQGAVGGVAGRGGRFLGRGSGRGRGRGGGGGGFLLPGV